MNEEISLTELTSNAPGRRLCCSIKPPTISPSIMQSSWYAPPRRSLPGHRLPQPRSLIIQPLRRRMGGTQMTTGKWLRQPIPPDALECFLRRPAEKRGSLILTAEVCPFWPIFGEQEPRVRLSASCSPPGSARRLEVTA
jgi:hypothetical protein